MIKIRYALSRKSNDRWPIVFQETCERTACDMHGNSEGLLELTLRLNSNGYDLINSRDELIKILNERKTKGSGDE